MNNPLSGEHYCEQHQGNHSHYAQHNCKVCKQQAEISRLRELLAEALRASDEHPDGPMLRSDTAAAIRKIIGDDM